MSGSITIAWNSPPLTATAAAIVVCRYPSLDLIPNVVCEQIERGIGPAASTARFRYILDTSGLFPEWPSDFEQIWPNGAEQPLRRRHGRADRGRDLDRSGRVPVMFDGSPRFRRSISAMARSS